MDCDTIIIWTVVLIRFIAPLFIPKYPLPAILVCLVVDGADQTVLQLFTGADLSGYQAYDKALDIFYLTIAMLATMRNWTHRSAVRIAQVLFYQRLLGVFLFEFIHWRPLLFLMPNTFEYFFIFYEGVRCYWFPERMSRRFYLRVAVYIWALIKIPQEYWLHIARLDVTDVIKTQILSRAAGSLWAEIAAQMIFFCILGLIFVFSVMLLRHVVLPKEHALKLKADPLPDYIDEACEIDRYIARWWHLFDRHLLEKVILVGSVSVIFAQMLPNMDVRPIQLFTATGLIALLNTFMRLKAARAKRSLDSVTLSFLLLALVNLLVVLVARLLLHNGLVRLPHNHLLFFLLLLTLIVTLYDRWRPVFDVRFKANVRIVLAGNA